MRVIITGGGTGGHIYPAITIADKIMDKSPGSEVLFIGTKRGLESKLVPERGYDIKFIEARGIDRKNVFNNIKTLNAYRRGKKKIKEILEGFQPDAIIGTGGYVTGNVVKTGAHMGIPCYIQEQNAVPGLANKLLEKYVETVFLGFEEAGKFFKKTEKHIVTGNPVRNQFFQCEKTQSRKELGIGADDFVIVAFGGSQGAGRINKAMIDVIEKYNGVSGVTVFFATGKYYNEAILADMSAKGIEIQDNIRIFEYIDEMDKVICSSDLVVSRSGAITVSEVAVCGKPAILIPSPNVTGNHQEHNAKAMADKGGALVVREADLERGGLFSKVESLRNDPQMLEHMGKNAAEGAPLDAADIIYYTLVK